MRDIIESIFQNIFTIHTTWNIFLIQLIYNILIKFTALNIQTHRKMIQMIRVLVLNFDKI